MTVWGHHIHICFNIYGVCVWYKYTFICVCVYVLSIVLCFAGIIIIIKCIFFNCVGRGFMIIIYYLSVHHAEVKQRGV